MSELKPMEARELTDLAIHWARKQYPDALIVEELAVANYGKASLDLGIITKTEIHGIEIKSHRDSHARLPLQGAVYGNVCTQMYLLPCPTIADRIEKHRPSGWGRLGVNGDLELAKKPYGKMLGLNPYQITDCLWASELGPIITGIVQKTGAPRPKYKHDKVNFICEHMTAPQIYQRLIDHLWQRDWHDPNAYPGTLRHGVYWPDGSGHPIHPTKMLTSTTTTGE